MAKLGLLFPFQEMVDIAGPIIEEEKTDVAYVKVITAAEAVNEARHAIDAGADIILSRGYAASLIKKSTNIPLIEMRIHAQEIGLLIKKAKAMLKKEMPHIGIVCYQNMLCDTSDMAELFDVKLTVSYIERIEESLTRVSELKKKGVDCIIGGSTTCDDANSLGIPALIYGSSVESIKEAFREAQKMAFAMEVEQRNEAQFETVLDTTFNGIIKINADGNIIVINKLVENLISSDMENVVGKKLMDVFPEFNLDAVNAILTGSSDNYTASVNIRKQPWILTMAPIQYNDMITGAILSLHRLQENQRSHTQFQKNMFMNGYVADGLFRHIRTDHADMKHQIELAQKYALSERPVLLHTEEGTEYYLFAEAIHNGSVRKNGPFVSVNMEGMDEEEQFGVLFGRSNESEKTVQSAALAKAQGGTLFLKGIDKCTLKIQTQLARLMKSDNSVKTDVQSMDSYNVRLIVTAREELRELVDKGMFSEELYYMLQGFVLHVLPLRERPEDLERIFKKNFSEFCKKYNKYLVLTNGACERIRQLKWNGNQLQVGTFCETLVLTTDKRSVDEVKIQKLYDSLYPRTSYGDGKRRVVVYKTPEEEEIREMLEKYHGNRGKIAEELGISTTTLWRKMKKYGIE